MAPRAAQEAPRRLGVRAKSRSEASAAIAAGGGLQDPHAIVWNPLRIILCLWAPARLARKHFRLGCLWRRLHLCTALIHTSSSSSSGCCQVNPNRDFSQSQKRKQGLSGWKVAKAILDSLRENMNLPGGTVAAVHVMHGYDSSVVEQALRSASSQDGAETFFTMVCASSQDGAETFFTMVCQVCT